MWGRNSRFRHLVLLVELLVVGKFVYEDVRMVTEVD